MRDLRSRGTRGVIALVLSIVASAMCSEALGDEVLEKGKAIYKNLCSECHGEKGEGGGCGSEPLYGDSGIRLSGEEDLQNHAGGRRGLMCRRGCGGGCQLYPYGLLLAGRTSEAKTRETHDLSRLTANQFRVSVSDAIRFF